MNKNDFEYLYFYQFLNGVCRHEHIHAKGVNYLQFLNGVCRHELTISMSTFALNFLNGVCRHEQFMPPSVVPA